MKIKKLNRWAISFFCTLLLGCGEDGIIGTGQKPDEGPSIKGAVQKGPFVRGSEVLFYNYNTGAVTNTVTVDSLGNFDFNPEQGEFYIVTGRGHYFNEIRVSVSAQPISLFAYYLADDDSNAFLGVNLLTDLAFRRIDTQIRSGIEPKLAIIEAQGQLVSAINAILPSGVSISSNFTSMSIYNVANTSEIENTFLLFFSAVTYQAAFTQAEYNSEIVDAILATLLNSLAYDIAQNGGFSEINKALLIEASQKLNPDKIAQILRTKSFEVSGEKLPVPDINIFLDTDGDGVANSIDNDDDGDGISDSEDSNPYVFEILPNEKQEILTQQNVAIELNLEFNRPPDRLINIIITKAAEHGQITGTLSSLVYTPDPGYRGLDHLTYYVESGTYKSTGVIVTIATF